MNYYYTNALPKGLPPKTVVNINKDLATLVLNSFNNRFTGESLDYVYNHRHGIVSHGFDPAALYEIFVSKDYSRALVLKVA